MVALERGLPGPKGADSSRLPRISAVVLASRDAARVRACCRGIRAQEPHVADLILAANASAAARNAAAAEATGDVLAFVDACVEVQPGWAAALARRFSLGATFVAGGIEAPDGRMAGGRRRAPGRHDLRGANGFLPIASASNVAIRRDVFAGLRGFDPLLSGAEDLDLSFRAQLAGHELTAAPEAAVTMPPTPLARTLRDELHCARAAAALRLKYSYFTFHVGLAAAGTPSTGGLARIARVLGRREPAHLPLVGAAAGAARSIGHALGWLELLSGWRDVPALLQPSSGAQELTAVDLPPAPSLLLIGEDRVAASLLDSPAA